MVQRHLQANEGVHQLEDTSPEIIKAKNKKSTMKKNEQSLRNLWNIIIRRKKK